MSTHTGARAGLIAELRAQPDGTLASASAQRHRPSTPTHGRIYRPLTLCLVLLGAASHGCANDDQQTESDDSADLSWLQQALGEDGGLDDAALSDGGMLDASLSDGGLLPPTPSPDGGPVGGDGGSPFPPSGPAPLANWRFDDCTPASTLLLDSSSQQANATRSGSVTCAAGVQGLSVVFDQRRDTVTATARPGFALRERVAVAAWVNPSSVKGGALINKQLAGNSAFELLLNNGNLVFRVALDNGRRVRQAVSRAPIVKDRWTHVAGQYDGSFVRLFVDGTQVGQVAASGIIADVQGALQLGNDLSNNFLNGKLDEVWLSAQPVTAADIADLSCLRGDLSVAVSPASSGPVAPGTTVKYDIAVSNGDRGTCAPEQVFLSAQPIPGFTVLTAGDVSSLAAGQTIHLSMEVTSSFEAEPGATQIPFQIFHFPRFEPLGGSVEYVMTEPSGCFVRTSRELLVRDLSVVEDPLRTTFDAASEDPRSGVWTFANLMRQLAPTASEAPAMVERMANTWLSGQSINSFGVPSRALLGPLVLSSWPRTGDGQLDLERSPLRLLAIVNRIDSRNLAQGHAGEGRFVFGVVDAFGFPLQFTVIFEYRLPAQTTADVQAWADAWHALGSLPFPSETYNAALQQLTDRFALRGVEPGRPNGSALAQLRTNEIALDSPWELREFELSASTGLLEPTTVKLTPDTSFLNESPLVADFVNQNEAAILQERHEVPLSFQGAPFLGGSSFNDLFAWRSAGIANDEARHKFSLNTCNGCHSAEETGTAFLHVFPRGPGQVAALSGFMTGISVQDPVTGLPRSFNDLQRRNHDLTQLVCTSSAPSSGVARASSATSAREAFLSRGISRVH